MNEYQLAMYSGFYITESVPEKKLFILIVKIRTQVVKRTSKIRTAPERVL